MIRFSKWSRFSLRTLLIATALIGLTLGVVERVRHQHRTAVALERMPGVSVKLASRKNVNFNPHTIPEFKAHSAAVASPWTYVTDSVYEVVVYGFREYKPTDAADLGRALRELPRLQELIIAHCDGEFFAALGPEISTESLRIESPADLETALQAVARFRRATNLHLHGASVTAEALRPLRGSSVRTLHINHRWLRTPQAAREFLKAAREVIPEIAVEVRDP